MDMLDKLRDPKIKWYVSLSFGGYFRGHPPGSPVRTFTILDDVFSLPLHFSETLKWHNGTGAGLTRVFANVEEAWDHVNETNPTTASPRNGIFDGFIGYSGYLIRMEVTDGTSKGEVQLIKRNFPQKEVLIFYISGGIPSIRVNDPPTEQGLTYTTNGTRGDGYTDLTPGRYVLFYPSGSTPSGVDVSNYAFSISPFSKNKRFTNECFSRWLHGRRTKYELYVGIKSPTDLYTYISITGSSSSRDPINVSKISRNTPLFSVYDDDPHCYAWTWAEDKIPYSIWTGWGEDHDGNVRFVLWTHHGYKHTTKMEMRYEFTEVSLYDTDTRDWWFSTHIKPIEDVYSYGRYGYVPHPYIQTDYYTAHLSQSRYVYIRTDDTIVVNPTPPTAPWRYYDGWGKLNVNVENEWEMQALVGLYTNDTTITITNPRDMSIAQFPGGLLCGVQIKPFMDRTLYAGNSYIVVARYRAGVGSPPTNDEFRAWCLRLPPRVFTSTEIGTVLSTLPFILGAGIPVSSEVTVMAPSTATPNSTITVSGSAGVANKTVHILLVDGRGAVLSMATTTTDPAGNYTSSLSVPNIPTGRYRVFAVVMP